MEQRNEAPPWWTVLWSTCFVRSKRQRAHPFVIQPLHGSLVHARRQNGHGRMGRHGKRRFNSCWIRTGNDSLLWAKRNQSGTVYDRQNYFWKYFVILYFLDLFNSVLTRQWRTGATSCGFTTEERLQPSKATSPWPTWDTTQIMARDTIRHCLYFYAWCLLQVHIIIMQRSRTKTTRTLFWTCELTRSRKTSPISKTVSKLNVSTALLLFFVTCTCRYMQLDDYWYYIETSKTGYGAVTRWEPMPSVFPHGMQWVPVTDDEP